FVDVSIVTKPAPQCLHAALVSVRGSADEIVIGQAHTIPQRAEFAGNFVGELLRRLTGGLRGALDLLPVLIRAGQEIRIGTEHALASRNRVTRNGRIRVPDMRARINVIDWSRDVELLVHEKLFAAADEKTLAVRFCVALVA